MAAPGPEGGASLACGAAGAGRFGPATWACRSSTGRTGTMPRRSPAPATISASRGEAALASGPAESIDAGVVGVVGLLNPVAGVSLGILAGGEALAGTQWLGLAIVLGCMAAVQVMPTRHPALNGEPAERAWGLVRGRPLPARALRRWFGRRPRPTGRIGPGRSLPGRALWRRPPLLGLSQLPPTRVGVSTHPGRSG